MKRFFLVSMAYVVAAAQLAPTQEVAITREGKYWVRTLRGTAVAVPMDRFRLDTIGNVVLKGDKSGQVSFTLKARVQTTDRAAAELLLRQFEVRTRNQNGLVFVTVATPRNISEAPEMSVTVPRTLQQVWVDSRAGDVQVSGLDAEVLARSMAGRMTVDDIKGSAEVRTGGGDIQVGTVSGPVRCYSGAGVIRVQSAGAESWFETAGGEIFVHQANGPMHAATAGGNIRVERATGPVYARTVAGLIDVQQASGTVTAESSGGAIQVNAANGVRCESAGGAIRLRNVGGALRASTAVGSILAELLSGNRIEESNLSTNSGDITVFISSNLPLTVLARNESAGSLGRIISDFPEIRVRTASQPGFSPVVAEGALNGGGPILHINVIGGTIYLRRQR